MKHVPQAFLFMILMMTALASAHSPQFTDEFMQERCNFTATGRNPYFVLLPGFTLVLEGEDEGDQVQLIIKVLDETRIIDGIETRVVLERESLNGELFEVSRNYFAICRPTNSVFYFGEDVNFYEDGLVVGHEGSWRAGRNGARAGIIMPGTLLIGARHYQEVAPDIALDRAEILKLDAVVPTPFGTFEHCLRVRETTPLEPDAVEFKWYAPGIGRVKDGELELTRIETAAGMVFDYEFQ